MKAKIIFVCASTLILSFTSCTKVETETFPEAKELAVKNEADAMENFSIALSKAACEHQEIRELIKSESLKKFDNDYDVLYQNIKNRNISDSGTFRDVLVSYMSSESVLADIERILPALTIYVSDVTWFDPNGFCAETWDTEDCRLAVTYKNSNGRCEKLFSNGADLGNIEEGTIPSGPVLIIKNNERIVTSVSTKSGDVTYDFIDDVYDGSLNIETKSNRHKGKYSKSWIAGQDPEDNSDIISATALNNLNPDIIKAYNMFKDHKYAMQNDYIYYGLTTSSPKGALRTDVRSKIVRFKIAPKSFNVLFDDPYDSDKNFVNSFETDDNGKGHDAEPSASEIYSKLWADGALEIRVRIAVFGGNENASIYKDFHYDVKAKDLFTIKDNSIMKEQWNSTPFKWYVTWRYSINYRDETTLAAKWYYPETSPDLPTWDLIENSAYSILVTEEDTGTEMTKSFTYTIKKARQTSVTVSGGVNAGFDNISATIKNDLGWSSSDEETKSGTITISCVNGDDHMTQELVSFGDKYITGQASSTSYIIDSYGSDRFTFTILPYRY